MHSKILQVRGNARAALPALSWSVLKKVLSKAHATLITHETKFLTDETKTAKRKRPYIPLKLSPRPILTSPIHIVKLGIARTATLLPTRPPPIIQLDINME